MSCQYCTQAPEVLLNIKNQVTVCFPCLIKAYPKEAAIIAEYLSTNGIYKTSRDSLKEMAGTAWCRDCFWYLEGEKVVSIAAQHHIRTGHEVCVTFRLFG